MLRITWQRASRRKPRQEWLDRLEREHDNLRHALRWLRSAGEAEQGLRLSWALWRFWSARSYLNEGRSWLEEFLALPEAAGHSTLRSSALFGAARLAFEQGDYAAASELFQQSLMIARDVGNHERTADALTQLGHIARSQGNFADALTYHQESLAIRRELGSTRDIAISLGALGKLALARGDYVAARSQLEESLGLFQKFGDSISTAAVLETLGVIERHLGAYERAVALHEKSLSLYRELGDGSGIAFSLLNLGLVAQAQGNLSRATTLLAGSLEQFRAMELRQYIPECLEPLARIACSRKQPRRAARILGAAEILRTAFGTSVPPSERVAYEQLVAELRAALPERELIEAWDAGSTMTLDQAISEAVTSETDTV